jgi:hypothetical protein
LAHSLTHSLMRLFLAVLFLLRAGVSELVSGTTATKNSSPLVILTVSLTHSYTHSHTHSSDTSTDPPTHMWNIPPSLTHTLTHTLNASCEVSIMAVLQVPLTQEQYWGSGRGVLTYTSTHSLKEIECVYMTTTGAEVWHQRVSK